LVIDNYLDGEYHIPYVHNGLNTVLDMNSYRIDLEPGLSIQTAAPSVKEIDRSQVVEGQDFTDRIGQGALYAMIYPNFAINRYGQMADTNYMVPLSHNKTLVIFDYFFTKEAANDKDYVKKCIAASTQVQDEDTMVCERLQLGLESRGYIKGRYAPEMEKATHHFHQYLATALSS
jgi:choline monooxygenase